MVESGRAWRLRGVQQARTGVGQAIDVWRGDGRGRSNGQPQAREIKPRLPDSSRLSGFYPRLQAIDGVFRMPPQANGQPAGPLPADPSLHVTSGALESSNSSPTAAMVGLIENARRFEMQMQVISESNTNADKANGILAVG